MAKVHLTELHDYPTGGRVILMDTQVIFPHYKASFDVVGKVQDFLDKKAVTVSDGYKIQIVVSNQGDPYRDGHSIQFYNPTTYDSGSVFLEDSQFDGYNAIKAHFEVAA